MSNSDRTILDCPESQSTSAGVIHSDPPRAKCCVCGHVYDIAAFLPTDEPSLGTVTLHTEGIIKGGADELVRAYCKAVSFVPYYSREYSSLPHSYKQGRYNFREIILSV
jgi:hypothetical protein